MNEVTSVSGRTFVADSSALNECTADDFRFSHHAPGQVLGSTTNKATPKKAKKGNNADLFASTEADFFGFPKKSE